MSSETLRKAAALMRERAEAEAVLRDGDPFYNVEWMPDGSPITEMSAFEMSWTPAVALAVADWLDVTAKDVGTSSLSFHAALAVARAYLGDLA